MTQLISISLDNKTAKIVQKLKAKNINISKAFCTALNTYWKKKLKEDKVD